MGWAIFPQNILTSWPRIPVNVIWFGNKIFADDQVKMRLLGLSLLQYHGCLYKREIWTQRCTKGRHTENTVCKSSYAWCYHRLGDRSGTDPPSQLSKESTLLTPPSQTTSLRNCEIISACASTDSVRGPLWQQPWKIDTHLKMHACVWYKKLRGIIS